MSAFQEIGWFVREEVVDRKLWVRGAVKYVGLMMCTG